MKLIFVDTGAFYALADRKDPAHARARIFYEECDDALVTTDFIFAETMSLVTKRLGKHEAIVLGGAIRTSARFRVEDVPPEVREQAWELFTGQADKEYDLIDCLSFAFMDALGIREAFGFDRHFRQAGFRLLPA